MVPRRCLIVDDDSSVRTYVKEVLERQQFQTIETEDGIQGLRMAEKLGDALDLIVSDLRMPGGDGLTFAWSVRESFPTLPIVIMSGNGESGQPKRPTISFEFLQKPFVPAALLTAIENAEHAMRMRAKASASG